MGAKVCVERHCEILYELSVGATFGIIIIPNYIRLLAGQRSRFEHDAFRRIPPQFAGVLVKILTIHSRPGTERLDLVVGGGHD